MSELTLLVLQLAFLLLLWVFIFAIVYALRSDLFGQRVRKLQPDAAAASAPTASSFPSSPVASAPAAAAAPTEAVTTPPSGGNGELASSDNARRLIITNGAKSGTEFPLGTDEITIGRSSDSAIIIRDDYTSTHHARLMLWNGRWMIQDLDSTNGTFLNGSRVTVPTPIPLGATVKVGATTFELRR
ncbi:FHA domain-containing protein [Agromyces sp. H3Y2-19a]|jgi:pSer/pThr/pTyr-binding forkhead associated (FHA) protein|uniref:FHA domain-containing protein FhaB/FipA n=1 Tax=Agromyces TaxID=33877 RepID=UPI001E4CDA12|nr:MULTISPECIES: FHA domain-containing protein [Agromyces]MCD5345389.1 FHA domain-containing protein [Agromyces sp. S2-1-8]MDF0515335.1 FHA domain-containing protein [Agromyces chromiiresistens]